MTGVATGTILLNHIHCLKIQKKSIMQLHCMLASDELRGLETSLESLFMSVPHVHICFA